MRRPHVYERSVPRSSRGPHQEPENRAAAARLLAAQLGNMIERAEAAGLVEITKFLEDAQSEAERTAAH